MKIKVFNEWNDPYSDEEGFLEMYGANVIADMEIRLKKEGLDIDPDTFYQKIDALNKEEQFETEISELSSKWYDKLYHTSKRDYEGEQIVTPEWKRIDNLVTKYHTEKISMLDDKDKKHFLK